jgi:hypothetical protein
MVLNSSNVLKKTTGSGRIVGCKKFNGKIDGGELA